MRAVLLDGDSLGLHDLSLHSLLTVVPELVIFSHTQADQTQDHIKDAAIVISNKVLLGREHMRANPTLKLIVIAATGTNNVDRQAAAEFGITVCNAQNYATESVAQHALTLLLMLATQAHHYYNDVQNGLWSAHTQFCLLHRPIVSLNGRTLGLVGAGNSAKRFAQLATALGMKVLFAQLAHRPYDGSKIPFDELLTQSDVLSLHCPLTPETQHLMNDRHFGLLKQNAFFINIARGGLVDNSSLIKVLRSGHLSGAAVDVFDVEPPPVSHPLLDRSLPNLLITPHNAWANRDARQALIMQIGDNIAAFQAGKPLRCV